ncbi:MAG: hypothetical protein KF753_05070 [Caldilineaceae bacterium]|nr:hypothetical protein [Caldilineaceae bacterium]
MAKRTQYSEETKAAVMAALLSGQSQYSVAQEYKIPQGTVNSWWRREGLAEGQRFGNPEQQDEIGGLLMIYLCASLRTLTAQVELFGDKSWLKQQGASELAVLHGVQTDKAIRLLEAMSQGKGEDGNSSA